MLDWDNLSWGYWKYPFIPSISRGKWLEPRHMVNVCDRWNKDKTNNLQFAFFNGVGYESWENIWGIWNGITPRDAEAIRRIAKIERRFADFLVSPAWEPHTPTLQYGVFASKWPLANRTLWTIVNRTTYNIDGPQLRVPPQSGMRYFDLWNGKETQARRTALSPSRSRPWASPPSSRSPSPPTPHSWPKWPSSARSRSPHFPKPGSTFLNSPCRSLPPRRPRKLRPVWCSSLPTGPGGSKSTASKSKAPTISEWTSNTPGKTLRADITPAPSKSRRSSSINTPSPTSSSPPSSTATKYHPADDHNFLRDWNAGRYPAGWDNKPVTWVSLEDARAYAAWAGKRLPHEWEWQYAAQGTDGRLYPWGNAPCDACVPKPEHGRELRAPTDVGAFPKGASPFGVMDLIGNVWQWTDEFQDEHTRAAILRGGGYYRPRRQPLVLPQRLPAQRARQVPADGSLERPRRYARLPLRKGRAVMRRHWHLLAYGVRACVIGVHLR